MKFILIEWYNHLKENDLWATTEDIFRDVDKAFKFAKSVKVRRIELIECGTAYKEDNGEWNYEDNSEFVKDRILMEVKK